METNTQYYQMLAGSTYANYLMQMTAAEEIKRAQTKPYIRLGGETFYIGKLPAVRQRIGFFRRMFRLIRSRR